ncbi:MAG: hypothetical protein US83_C0001G0033 [Candidatus Falkowbacteria bacterium GW2011_GWC2_38_22]|uniref:Glycosyltransferase 2-like domain-containing protein n=1 Tax=Candidatus Falkowbacteria bacterium GW2011_GWE1_38_31 TaxID=1618638 RepID=A0A0G0MB20_9BACT|nr:MAG: hypothetical protein US73_C0004G0095 [Candidatus Falkowbacteria bacterium GW2011_GWF2_38_1205]KKQ62099.1 MAG: hypothetical protein US83_C0001G0033 [Candidatus Falkowbacteria bacterium GW2011_GWC2_38_22]KKQ64249.1 MAG: hypothetical protein US84_C0001G0033 [Candidatus Falkowbacteria bacterium GW2011_GWF1_38_22]KKQ66226.1 MAG: hypothetical protein US87_C0002G0033 [Candidatus Falkowbacteria bacterium GW2011_GWE2_38_254]KKQ70954.1 MAG: hypothetical protein US91_C0002G0033 [Candidatus Falkowb
MNYLKIGKASELSGRDRKLYRALEILPGVLSWSTLLLLFIFSYIYPVWVAFFIIAFDVYWLLLVVYLGIHLISSYYKIKENTAINWREKLKNLKPQALTRTDHETGETISINLSVDDIIHLVIFPIALESLEVIRTSIKAIADSAYSSDNMIILLSIEERGGVELKERAEIVKKEYEKYFRNFIITIHPDGLVGELKGKGANQSWGAEVIKKDLIDKENIDYDKIIVSVFDIDTIIYPDYFYCLTYRFLTTENPYRASYQPIPVYHNNVWQAPFFARVAASSNTFWQMMQQIRQEKLATYSSHSMTWRALVEVGLWSKTMVSEDSRIFWHCFCYYNGDYRVEPLYYPVSMDVTMDNTAWQTAKNLYKQQRRWGWGVENIPYLIFNAKDRWSKMPKGKVISRIFVQLYGFHSWATNALIIGVIGWMPMLLGGDRFNSTVLSTNLPFVTRTLMIIAMSGLVLSAILSTILLPPKPKKYGFFKHAGMLLQWIVLPISIIIFGSIPGLDSQTRLMFGKYLGFFVTPKSR